MAAFTMLLATSLAALLGLVAEGGQVLSARQAAMQLTEQAARSGAAQLSAQTLHTGGIIDPGIGPLLAAERVMAAAGHPGTATEAGGVVTAQLKPYSVSTPLLALVGVPSVTVTASASAAAVAG